MLPRLPSKSMPPVSQSQGYVGLGLLLRQLKTTGVMMYACAHPDDENNPVLAALGWGGWLLKQQKARLGETLNEGSL